MNLGVIWNAMVLLNARGRGVGGAFQVLLEGGIVD